MFPNHFRRIALANGLLAKPSPGLPAEQPAKPSASPPVAAAASAAAAEPCEACEQAA